ncbi:MAG: TonB-dependent receptor [Bacteroidota bacterium]
MNRKTIVLTIYICLSLFPVFSQDTLILNEVHIDAYFEPRPLLRLPSSAAIIDSALLKNQVTTSLVSSVNTVSGVRMEERSPGSYRVSIRGSLLRSPFGIRNVKLYIDDFPLTDAGGNTYLNIIDPSAIKSMEILKGPDGSLFGANSGGVVSLKTFNDGDSTIADASFQFGSYNTTWIHAQEKIYTKKNVLSLQESLQNSDGYRDNSGLERKYIQLGDAYHYREDATLRVLFLYADLNYETPGGLTLQQFKDDPQQARPSTAFLPGAEQQKAGITNKTVFAGVAHSIQLTPNVMHVITFSGSHTDFKNPFITNYETRKENNVAVRTWFQFKNKNESSINWKINTGAEIQDLQSHITNNGNNHGEKDTLQAKNKLDAEQGFAFAQYVLDINHRLSTEVSASINFTKYRYESSYPAELNSSINNFDPQLMPRLGISYSITPSLAWRFIISRGYSPPTIAEVLASDNIINFNLQPESGWNYETGFRFHDKHGILWWDVAAYYYKLQDAIVRRVHDNDTEFFINAGGTDQKGIESQLSIEIIKQKQTGIIRHLQLNNSITYSDFTFADYINAKDDYSGNDLTGVPEQIIVSSLVTQFPAGFHLYISHNSTGSLPVNDSNTAYADAYDLVQLKLTWKTTGSRWTLEVFGGVDNALDEKYSLGNDLNAVGGRFFNAAGDRSYFAGLKLAVK